LENTRVATGNARKNMG